MLIGPSRKGPKQFVLQLLANTSNTATMITRMTYFTFFTLVRPQTRTPTSACYPGQEGGT